MVAHTSQGWDLSSWVITDQNWPWKKEPSLLPSANLGYTFWLLVPLLLVVNPKRLKLFTPSILVLSVLRLLTVSVIISWIFFIFKLSPIFPIMLFDFHYKASRSLTFSASRVIPSTEQDIDVSSSNFSTSSFSPNPASPFYHVLLGQWLPVLFIRFAWKQWVVLRFLFP